MKVKLSRYFFELGVEQSWNFGEYGKLFVILPDYRARIDELRISYRSLEIRARNGDLPPDQLVTKIYAENVEASVSSDDLQFVNGSARYSLAFDPRRIIVVLLDKEIGERIDERDIYLGLQVRQTGVFYDRPEEQIRELIANGEDKHLEFKSGLSNENREDFLETVVSFANSEGGLLLIGINDNRVPIGCHVDTEDIIKRIRDSCEPLIEPKFRNYALDGHDILAVEIQQGLDKPYMIKHKGVIYVRIGPNDVPASRVDLEQILRERSSRGTFGPLG